MLVKVSGDQTVLDDSALAATLPHAGGFVALWVEVVGVEVEAAGQQARMWRGDDTVP